VPRHRLRIAAQAGEQPRPRALAFVIVSSVVKVLEDAMKRVSAGSRSRVASTMSVPSTFDTKRKVIPRSV
jgi:hypothetical protein